MRVLITGASGFLGRHVVAESLRRGHSVRALVRGSWPTAVCGRELRDVVAAIRYVIELVGEDFVGLGSDFDGGTKPGYHAGQLPALTQAMLDDGLSAVVIRKVLGENAARVLRKTLPQRTPR